jgi:uncharacterized protein (TIGR02147 family)
MDSSAPNYLHAASVCGMQVSQQEAIVVLAQQELRKVLVAELEKAREKNRSYSMNAFARRLNWTSSALSEFLSGKRQVSRKLAERLLTHLYLDLEKNREILSLFPNRQTRSDERYSQYKKLMQIDADKYKSISEWYHMAILSLSETEDFQSDPNWIAQRLNISINTANQALERLMRLGLLYTDNLGQVRSKPINYATMDNEFNLALRRAHKQNFELMEQSFDEDEINVRDITAMTLAVSPDRFKEAQSLIREFHQKFCRIMESGPKREVYKLCIQYFPLSKKANENDQ